ncbi:unnamed protein product [Bursaphelenchus okinawaensis]|uniref:Uncharacterized protein n=1 Tax=Bursaphelenchus okinawaensis TaxID=465554 RepID=A0A811KQR7_9BILA|nr:unnamed protein product [Bursaphelenchus okinawaensis]CAG9107681.1 unnamed protein product [Bursaphelenchus okinawaensis]
MFSFKPTLLCLLLFVFIVSSEYTCEDDSDCTEDKLPEYYCRVVYGGAESEGAECKFYEPAGMKLCDFKCSQVLDDPNCMK